MKPIYIRRQPTRLQKLAASLWTAVEVILFVLMLMVVFFAPMMMGC